MTSAALQVIRTRPASQQDGTYPRPLAVRESWASLDRRVGFAHDDDLRGLDEGWHLRDDVFTDQILLPFPPESKASGVAATGFHPCVWYRIELTPEDLAAAGHGDGRRLLLHFGAVDHHATVWVDGHLVGTHEGGQTAFAFDITSAIADTAGDRHVVTVRAYEDPHDMSLPRCKQDWWEKPHGIWYERTTGIWRSVWLESVPQLHIQRLAWRPSFAEAKVTCFVEFPVRPAEPVQVDVALVHDGRTLAAVSALASERTTTFTLDLPGDSWTLEYDGLIWTPASPTLLDAAVVVHGPDGTDEIASYVGLRDVTVTGNSLSLSARPFYLRSVLEQGYWEDSHLTPPSPAALREEVELILSLGFNSARIHQKVEDPRFHFWADKLGLTLWNETAATFAFDSVAVSRLTTEWIDIVRAYESHPSVIAWVPFNESWGIDMVASSPQQAAFSRALTDLTRALDPTRPVISNDGWEHTDSDLITIHDYSPDGNVLRDRYADGIDALLDSAVAGPRPVRVGDRQRLDVPVLLTEIGGVRFTPGDDDSETWGYSSATTPEDFAERIAAILEPIQASAGIAGFCWTQITDTLQEANGLCTADRTPKLPAEDIRRIVQGEPRRGASIFVG